MTGEIITPDIRGRPARRVTVWFYGDCPLCTREIAIMRSLDRTGGIDFIDLTAEPSAALPHPGDRCAMLSRLHAQEGEGPVVSGARAFAAMWRAIPLLRPIGRLAQHEPILWLLERLYLVFLRFRPALQAVARRAATGGVKRGRPHGG